MKQAQKRVIAIALAFVIMLGNVIPVNAALVAGSAIGASYIGASSDENHSYGSSGSGETGINGEQPDDYDSKDFTLGESHTLGKSGDEGYTVTYPDNPIRIPADAQPNASIMRTASGTMSISDAPLGSYVNVQIGNYKYPFVVVAKNNYNVNGVTLMSMQSLATITTSHYSNSPYVNTEFMYQWSAQRTYLTGEFYQSISTDIKSIMLRPTMYASHADNVDGFGRTYTAITDYVFIPAVHEIVDGTYYGNDSEKPTKWGIAGTSSKNKMVPLDVTWNTSTNDMSSYITTRDAKTSYMGVSGTTPYPYRQTAYYTRNSIWDYKGKSYYTSFGVFPFDVSFTVNPCIYITPSAKISSTTNNYTSTNGKKYDAYDFVFNTPPTTPGAVTVPNAITQWETTDISISWVASTDADGDPITYTVERSINGGTYTVVTTTDSTSYTDTVTSAMTSTVQYRVKASDGQGESGYSISSISSIVWDTTAPTIQVTASPAAGIWTCKDVTLTITASDNESGLATLIVPAGVQGAGVVNLSGITDTRTYTVAANGSYDFTVVDNSGNSSKETIQVDNIDRTPPTIEIVSNESTKTESSPVIFTVTAKDDLSGVAGITLPDGSYVSGGHGTFTARTNGTYIFKAHDVAGNTTPESIVVTSITGGEGNGGNSNGNNGGGSGGGNSSGGSSDRDKYPGDENQGNGTGNTCGDCGQDHACGCEECHCEHCTCDACDGLKNAGQDRSESGNINDNPQMGAVGFYHYWLHEDTWLKRLSVMSETLWQMVI